MSNYIQDDFIEEIISRCQCNELFLEKAKSITTLGEYQKMAETSTKLEGILQNEAMKKSICKKWLIEYFSKHFPILLEIWEQRLQSQNIEITYYSRRCRITRTIRLPVPLVQRTSYIDYLGGKKISHITFSFGDQLYFKIKLVDQELLPKQGLLWWADQGLVLVESINWSNLSS